MRNKLWWFIPLILLLVAIQIRTASGKSQDLRDRPENSTIIDLLKNGATNALKSLSSISYQVDNKNASQVNFGANRGTTELDRWIVHLSLHENCGYANNKEGRILDSNGLYSYGPFCFQESTFINFVKRYNLLPYSEDAEIMNWVQDYEFGHNLVKMIVIEDKENAYHWSNTLKKVGLPPVR